MQQMPYTQPAPQTEGKELDMEKMELSVRLVVLPTSFCCCGDQGQGEIRGIWKRLSFGDRILHVAIQVSSYT